MSVYTNDTDTLRQVISQSIPQFLASLITVVSVFISMCVLSLYLTFIVVIMLIVMKVAMSKIAGQSGVYFTKQQQNLGKVNGYIEEMMNGQKMCIRDRQWCLAFGCSFFIFKIYSFASSSLNVLCK